ncbi:MAG: hypothetical protein IKD18_04015 [Clostridia bacterium]|nr:hypothetical protein [Clostridia bacterium]
MVLSNVWGGGQIFAFSALDGDSFASDDFMGILDSDRVGIRFFSKVKRELILTGLGKIRPAFEGIGGDFLSLVGEKGETCRVVYARRHLIVGKLASPAAPLLLCHGRAKLLEEGDLLIQDTGDGDVSALLTRGDGFALAFGHSVEAVRALAQEGAGLDADEEYEKKLALYRRFSLREDHPFARLYAKCLSTMKTQLYTPEGNFSHTWSTPDRLPHRGLWLWDSVFHAVGFRNLDPALAQELILAVIDVQREDGFIPHFANWEKKSKITQPPVLAWGARKVYEKSGDRAFLKQVYTAAAGFWEWLQENRRPQGASLYAWYTKADQNCRCDECGMDNSPRFDTEDTLLAIDLSCFMANEARHLAAIARELGESGEIWDQRFCTLQQEIDRLLWSEEDGFYFDYNLNKGALHKVWAVSSFLPLFAGLCSPKQAAALLGHLQDPQRFGTTVPIPSISKNDATFGSDMWRGPVWINYNYMVIEGLEQYGFGECADEIREKTLAMLDFWYRKRGSLFEFYDSENRRAPWELNRKGPPFEPYDFEIRTQAIRDYGWSNTLTFDLLSREL